MRMKERIAKKIRLQGVSTRTNNFTLLEMIMVISIIMIVGGLSFAYMGRMPAGLILSRSVTNIEALMTTAQQQATLQGKQKDVILDLSTKIFFITKAIDNPEELDDLSIPTQSFSNEEKNINKKEVYTLPKDIAIEIEDWDDDKVIFSFFPDGSASGPEIILEIKGHTISINISQLTGIVTTKDISEE